MNSDLHIQFAKIDGDFEKVVGQLHIHKYDNQVVGPCLSVAIIAPDGTKVYVYGLNDGHRGQGWIHYHSEVEKDLLKILDTMWFEQEKKREERERRHLKDLEEKHKKMVAIFDGYKPLVAEELI